MISKYRNLCITLIFLFLFISFTQELTIPNLKKEELSQNENLIKPPSFSKISGFYPDNFKLKLFSEENNTIYYTLDSTDPRNSTTKREFTDYILIYDRTQENNIYSALDEDEDSPISISRGHRYKAPNYPVDKAMIVRAVAMGSNGEFSEVISKTYFITNEDLYKYEDLTVISLVTNPENLFGPDIGIYVTGSMYQNWKKSDEYDPTQMPWDLNGKCNYFMKGEEWEREAFITIFDKSEKILEQNLGIRIKGAATRIYPSKSFNLYARKKYGKSKIETDILKDNFDLDGNLITTYKSLTIRSVYDEGRLRDKLGRDLFYSRKGLTSTNMRNSVLFINGEYWGFYIIQEKLDDNFISNNFLIPKDNIAIAKDNEIEDGPEEEIQSFIEFCNIYSKKDFSDKKVFEEIQKFLDVDSFIEVFGSNIYISNLDWPGKNDGEWRNFGEKIEGNEFSDGKWRFIIYDLDYSMGARFYTEGGPHIDNFVYAERAKDVAPVNLFLAMLKNSTDFKNKFTNVYCDYANDIYSSEKIKKLIEEYREECTDLVAYSSLRWSGRSYESKLEGYSYYKTYYYKALDSLIKFYEERPKYSLQHLKEYAGLKGELVDLNLEIKGKGKIKISSIIPNFKEGKWTGKYFTRIPISIKAIPDIGYTFKEWTGYKQSTKLNDEIILFETATITAVFV